MYLLFIFPGGLVVKNLCAHAGDLGDTDFIPESGRFPLEGGMATHSSIPAWRIPQTEGLMGYSP